MTLVAMVISIVIAFASLVWAYFAGGLPQVANGLIVVGALWLVGEWRRLKWASPLALLVIITGAAGGLWLGLPPSLMVVGAVAGLLGWDFSGFAGRLAHAAPTDDIHGLEMRHLARAAIVGALALVIAGLATFVHLKIPFELAVGLILVGALGLTRLVFWIQRENDL